MNLNDEWDEAFRMGVEAMRAACIAVAEELVQEYDEAPGYQRPDEDYWHALKDVIYYLREVQP